MLYSSLRNVRLDTNGVGKTGGECYIDYEIQAQQIITIAKTVKNRKNGKMGWIDK